MSFLYVFHMYDDDVTYMYDDVTYMRGFVPLTYMWRPHGRDLVLCVCVCVCVCVRARARVRACVRIHTRARAHTHARTYTQAHTYTHALYIYITLSDIRNLGVRALCVEMNALLTIECVL